MPQSHYEYIASGNRLRWVEHVHWARFILKDKGLLDASERGIWQISEAGRQWVVSHKNDSWDIKRESILGTHKRKIQNSGHKVTDKTNKLSYYELSELKEILPADKFEQFFGPTWRLSQQHNKVRLITALSDEQIVALVRPKIKQIQSLVIGESSSIAPSEIPGLIEFCYRLELFSEGATLFARLDPSSVDNSDYIRAKKIAEICRLKLT
jgi:hypothetical protein